MAVVRWDRRDDTADRAAAFLQVLRSEEREAPPLEFIPQGLTQEDVSDLIGVQEVSRIHFASAAAWWKSAPNNNHAHSPNDVHDIENWLRGTLSYLLRELDRL